MKTKQYYYKGKGTPIVTFKGKLYKVKFHHDRDYHEVDTKNTTNINGRTIAFIVDKDDPDTVLLEAMAYCSSDDQYNKLIGRAKSAGRLISKLKTQNL